MTVSTLLGLDLGTSSVKAVVTDLRGRSLGEATRTYDVLVPAPGRAEAEPQTWWARTVEAATEAIGAATATGAAAPGAVGLSGQMHGVVLADAAGTPLRPAILWADARADAELSAYAALPEPVRARLANPAIAGLAGPILRWVAAHEPDLLPQARWALQPKDWVRWRLTGEVHAEPSDASATLLYDVPGDRWDVEAATLLGLDPRLLAPLLPWSGSPAGSLTPAAALELGLAAGTPVAAGAGDTAAAMFGSGIGRDGMVQMTLGTGGQLVRALDAAVPAAGGGTTLFRTAARHGWYAMAATLNAGLALDWVRRTLDLSWEGLYAAADHPVASDSPFFLPHLSGERTPWLDPHLRGAWTGLGLDSDRSAMAAAALEGVAFAMREALDALVPDDQGAVRLAGGGTRVPAWRRLLADVLDRPLDAVEAPGASGRGAALLGGCAAGELDEGDVFGRLAPPVERVAEPDPAAVGLRAERRQVWRAQVEAIRATRR